MTEEPLNPLEFLTKDIPFARMKAWRGPGRPPKINHEKFRDPKNEVAS